MFGFKSPVVYLLAGSLLGASVMFFLPSPYSNNRIAQNSNTGSLVRNENLASSSNLLDAHFIEQMIPHHEDAVTMARIAQNRAEHQEIRQLATNIISSQSSEIDQMKSWYKSWYSQDVPSGTGTMGMHGMKSSSGMHMGMMGSDTDLNRLEKSTEFDKEFIEHMIPHHQMAVMMAQMLKRGTERPEMQKLADDIITAQNKEIDDMRQWYANWGY